MMLLHYPPRPHLSRERILAFRAGILIPSRLSSGLRGFIRLLCNSSVFFPAR